MEHLIFSEAARKVKFSSRIKRRPSSILSSRGFSSFFLSFLLDEIDFVSYFLNDLIDFKNNLF